MKMRLFACFVSSLPKRLNLLNKLKSNSLMKFVVKHFRQIILINHEQTIKQLPTHLKHTF